MYSLFKKTKISLTEFSINTEYRPMFPNCHLYKQTMQIHTHLDSCKKIKGTKCYRDCLLMTTAFDVSFVKSNV